MVLYAALFILNSKKFLVDADCSENWWWIKSCIVTTNFPLYKIGTLKCGTCRRFNFSFEKIPESFSCSSAEYHLISASTFLKFLGSLKKFQFLLLKKIEYSFFLSIFAKFKINFSVYLPRPVPSGPANLASIPIRRKALLILIDRKSV